MPRKMASNLSSILTMTDDYHKRQTHSRYPQKISLLRPFELTNLCRSKKRSALAWPGPAIGT